MKTVTLLFGNLYLDIDFEFIEGQEETREDPPILETVYIHQIRLSDEGWEQDNIPQKALTMIKEMLLDRDYVEIITDPISNKLERLFGDINPTI